MFMAMVDRHDGTCAGRARRDQKAPYLMRYLFAAGGLSGTTPTPDELDESGAIMKPHQRELVGLNAAGFVLFDRNWDYQGGGVNATGPTEEFKYQQTTRTVQLDSGGTVDIPDGMRLIEHRSLGWGVGFVQDLHNFGAAATGGCNPLGIDCASPKGYTSETRGLISRFCYLDVPDATQTDGYRHTTLLKSESIKEGVCGDAKLVQDIQFVGNTEEQSGVTRYRYDRATGAFGATMQTNLHREYYDPTTMMQIKRETTWQAAAQAWPGGPDLIPFESKFWNQQGQQIGRSYGLCGEISSTGIPGPGAAANATTIFVDVYGYGPDGQRVLEIVDANVGYSGSGTAAATDPSHRKSWDSIAFSSGDPRLPTAGVVADCVSRVSEFATRLVPADKQIPPLNLTTGYAYSGMGDLEVTAKPGGRFDFTVLRYAIPPQDVDYAGLGATRLLTAYSDGTIGTDGNLHFGRSGQMASVMDGRPIRTWSVAWASRVPRRRRSSDHRRRLHAAVARLLLQARRQCPARGPGSLQRLRRRREMDLRSPPAIRRSRAPSPGRRTGSSASGR